jgi:tetratricopeptide (TPR) repeat protein
MEARTETTQNRSAVLVASTAIAVVLIWQTAKIWRADSLLRSGRLDNMERAVQLEPGNAEPWDRLGRQHLYDLANPDPAKAVSDFAHAVETNPLSAHYWMDLASACELSGDAARAREAFEKARAVYPASAEVAWYYGNFLLRQQDPSGGFSEIQRAVRTDPTFLPLAISRTWRSNHDVNLLLDRALPAEVTAYFAALDYFTSIREGDAALTVWQRLVSLGKPFSLPRTFAFFDELIREDRSEDAARVWLQALAAAALPYAEPANRSLVWNGDFARDFLNGGLDWRWNNPVGITIDFDSAPPSTSGRSIRLDFGGGMNLNVIEPFEYVPVEPNRLYHFHARMRTETITTESGVRFALTDPNRAQPGDTLTENLTGSQSWAAVEADVRIGPATHFLLIQLRRVPSRLFENKLSGSAWMADVSLIPQSNEAGQESP